MSLVLRQVAHPQQALQEVYRVLRSGGRVLVGTVALEVTLRAWVPFCFFPKVAHLEAARLPAIDVILSLCQQAGFRELHTRMVCRNARVDLHRVGEELRQRKRPSYRLLTDAELENGLRLIEVARQGTAVDRSETPCPHHRGEISRNASSDRPLEQRQLPRMR
jgi:SAM-dependent methyltransferase